MPYKLNELILELIRSAPSAVVPVDIVRYIVHPQEVHGETRETLLLEPWIMNCWCCTSPMVYVPNHRETSWRGVSIIVLLLKTITKVFIFSNSWGTSQLFEV